MLNSKHLNKLIFLDVETVPQTKSFYDMSMNKQDLFLRRFKKDAETMMGLPMDEWSQRAVDDLNFYPEGKIEPFYNNRAALHPEFAKIVCISIGWFDKTTPTDLSKLDTNYEFKFKTKSFYGTDEAELLKSFYKAMESVLSKYVNHEYHLVAYNGKSFDFPMISKRFLLNWLPLPPFFDTCDLKPWEVGHLQDPKEIWKFGVYDANVSLPLLCEVFGIPTPKDDISGKDVRDVYYNEEKGVGRIATYCSKDVVALATLYLRMKGIRNQVTLQ